LSNIQASFEKGGGYRSQSYDSSEDLSSEFGVFIDPRQITQLKSFDDDLTHPLFQRGLRIYKKC
jgi:hypothetical protein